MMSVTNFLFPSLQSANRERMRGEREALLVRGRGPRLEQGPQSHAFRGNTRMSLLDPPLKWSATLFSDLPGDTAGTQA